MKPNLFASDNPCSQSLTKHGELFVAGAHYLRWEEFLPLLEAFCDQQGWEIEYGHPSDGSCAIFSRGCLLSHLGNDEYDEFGVY